MEENEKEEQFYDAHEDGEEERDSSNEDNREEVSIKITPAGDDDDDGNDKIDNDRKELGKGMEISSSEELKVTSNADTTNHNDDNLPRLSHYELRSSGKHPLADLNPPFQDESSESDLTTSTTSETMTKSSFALSDTTTCISGTNNYPRKVKVKIKKKTISEFKDLYLIQELSTGGSSPVYSAKFSYDGNYLATAGEEGQIRIWKLLVDDALAYLEDHDAAGQTIARSSMIFQQEPHIILVGHKGPVLDLSWSKNNNFLLSASMDHTVRLWHHSRGDCLGVFRHPDFVTCVAFHPRDDRLFVTGSLDCRFRLWSLTERCVRAWNELPTNNFVTAVAFNNSGRLALAGTSTGVCLVFETEVYK